MSVEAGAIGGAAAAGGEYFRDAVVAWFVAHGLRGRAVASLDLCSAVPSYVGTESRAPTDDIEVRFNNGARADIQAKRSVRLSASGTSPFGRTVEQWKKSVLAGLSADGHRLVLATADATAPVRDLGGALTRRRENADAILTADEERALRRFREAMGDFSRVHREALERAVVIMDLSLVAPEQGDAALGAELLDGHVVSEGEGAAAWGDVVAKGVLFAMNREGRDIRGWQSVLRRARRTLCTDVAKSESARVAARDAVLASYRARVCSQWTQLDFRDAGLDIPPIPFEMPPQVLSVDLNDGDDATTVPLCFAAERFGRIILLGQPGGGKSSALRFLGAYYASQQGRALPILLHANRMARLLAAGMGPEDTVLMEAAHDVPADERVLFLAGVREHAGEGQLLLLLDSLDEVAERTHRLAVIRCLAAVLHGSLRWAKAVVATRDSAFGEARTLVEFEPARLKVPVYSGGVERDILRAIAVQRKQQDADNWVSEAAAKVAAFKKGASEVAATPLMSALLTWVAATLPAAPRLSRAEVLMSVVRERISRWEIQHRNESLTLGSLSRTEAEGALRITFGHLGFLILELGAVSNARAIADLTPVVARDFSLAPLRAEAVVRDALRFWDLSGFFVVNGADDQIERKLSSFVEVGAAERLANMGASESEASVRQLLADETKHEAVLLAAQLSKRICDLLLKAASENSHGNLDRDVVLTLGEGAVPSPEALSAFVDTLIGRTGGSPAMAWAAAKLLATLPLSSADQARAMRAADTSLPTDHKRLLRAYASFQWRVPALSSEEDLLAVLSMAPLKNLGPPPEYATERDRLRGVLLGSPVDEAFGYVIEKTIARMLPARPDLAALAWAATGHLSLAAAPRVRSLIASMGHLPPSDASEQMERHAMLAAAMGNQDDTCFLRLVAGVTARRATGRRPVVRRFDALLSLANAVRSPALPHHYFAGAMRKAGSSHQALLRALITLTQLDEIQVATEAEEWLNWDQNEPDIRSMVWLFLLRGSPVASSWPTGDIGNALVDALLDSATPDVWSATIACHHLAAAPNRERAREGLKARGAGAGGLVQYVITATVLELEDDPVAAASQMLRDTAQSVRLAAARSLGALAAAVDSAVSSRAAFVTVLADQDGGVLSEFLNGFVDCQKGPPPNWLVPALTAVRDALPQAWTCLYCGRGNAADSRTCKECSTANPAPGEVARRILAPLSV